MGSEMCIRDSLCAITKASAVLRESYWQGDRDSRSDAEGALDIDLAAVQIDDVMDEEEAETKAGCLADIRSSEVFDEDLGEFTLGNADAAVGYRYYQVVADSCPGDPNP